MDEQILKGAVWGFSSWWLNQPFEKYAPQIGSNLPQVGMNIKKYLSYHHLVFFVGSQKKTPWDLYGVTQKKYRLGLRTFLSALKMFIFRLFCGVPSNP